MDPSSNPQVQRFDDMYRQPPPWDIGRPQPMFVEAADPVVGSVLDAGCGTGELALFFAQRGHAVTGIDFVPAAIEQARQKARQRGLEVNFLVLDATRLDDLPQQFDTILDCGLFHVFSDEDRRRYVAGLLRRGPAGSLRVAGLLQRRRTARLWPAADRESANCAKRLPRAGRSNRSSRGGLKCATTCPTRRFPPTVERAWFCVIRRSQ